MSENIYDGVDTGVKQSMANVYVSTNQIKRNCNNWVFFHKCLKGIGLRTRDKRY